jgi:hypothetical protein
MRASRHPFRSLLAALAAACEGTDPLTDPVNAEPTAAFTVRCEHLDNGHSPAWRP